MNRLPSSQFRLYYGRLDAPTEVTANGRVIGTWTPAPFAAREPSSPDQLDRYGEISSRVAAIDWDDAGVLSGPPPLFPGGDIDRTLIKRGVGLAGGGGRDMPTAPNSRAAQKQRDAWLRKANG